ncbi:MAG: transcriptional repressor [Clostridia bacterium]|nr:transcriptional repressor [Clostridia bacterium]
MTRQRQLIADIICSSCEHLSADQIYHAAHTRMPSIAVGTVYRNLALMVEEGEIRRIAVAGGADRYDRNLHPHDHLLCVRCGAVCDIGNIPLVSDDTLTSRLPDGWQHQSHELVVRCICPACVESHYPSY